MKVNTFLKVTPSHDIRDFIDKNDLTEIFETIFDSDDDVVEVDGHEVKIVFAECSTKDIENIDLHELIDEGLLWLPCEFDVILYDEICNLLPKDTIYIDEYNNELECDDLENAFVKRIYVNDSGKIIVELILKSLPETIDIENLAC